MHTYIIKAQFLFLVLVVFVSNSWAQADLYYYMPEGISYNANVPTPKSVLGHEVGEWHVSHDKLTYYFYELAEASENVAIEKMGVTYENRPLLNVIITSKENHNRLDEIRKEHLKLSDPDGSNGLDIPRMPVVIRLGYSVHGNEQSGSNASLLVAYHLAAAQGKEIEEILDNCIILIDPSLNPDGMQRFSSWVNEHKSKNLNGDPNSREFEEPWPNGRTNHYWFDLNRDWLLAQHPESIARLKVYHDWMPNVQTDHHEMGSDATFFFQPGVPARKHPLIPDDNVSLTAKIGKFHAEALDKNKRLYYSKESFDDFYFGKGSTYPDLQGGIGILFEQASVRGHLRETQNGSMSFPFAVKNQFITSLSTIDAAHHLKADLLNFQKDFYVNATHNNKSDKNRALIVGTKHDPARSILLGQVLLRHQIELYKPSRDVKINGKQFFADKSMVIPLHQAQNKLVKAIFERRTSFKDSLFYDVSAWNFDLSYNADLEWIENINSVDILGDKITELELPKGEVVGGGAYAYAVDWNQYYAPGLVNGLLKSGLILKVATEPFSTNSGEHFKRGTILVPVGIQKMGAKDIFERLEKYASIYHAKVVSLKTGLSSAGIDLGSNGFKNIRKPEIAMLVDNGVSGYEAGEVWHLLDQRYDMHATMISTGSVDRTKLQKYNTLVLPGGSYSGLNLTAQEGIKQWVKEGGTLIAWRDALRLLSKLQIADVNFKKVTKDTTHIIPYADQSKYRGAQVIGGAIFNMKIDPTHPLAYGYDQQTLPVFKRGTLFLEPAKRKVSNPFRYTEHPLLSGYVSKENLKKISGSPAVSVSSFGKGKVIAFVDDHNFRAFWYGTNRLFINSMFFGNQISTR